MREPRRRTRWDQVALVALPMYWISLFVATHYPRATVPAGLPHGDKLMHLAAFGLLAYLRWRFERARRRIGDRFVWTSGAVLVGYAAFDEYLQQFVGRFTDPLDFVADATGIVLVLAALELRRRRRRA